MLYDVFISHASEDKPGFVRSLAEELRKQNVAVWYDEFTLKPGDSLRRSIALGLRKSRFGIVVLSQAFIRKPWPQWELDGLVQRQTSSGESVILPLWLDVSHADVLPFSPSLADKYAVKAEVGLDAVVEELLRVIKPQGSSLVFARDRLIEIGYDPPVVTDDWWHRAIEYCGSNPAEGTFQDAMGWGRWGFPLPTDGNTAAERGARIAWAAMQLGWQDAPETQRISQVTKPDLAHEFISSIPGLVDACYKYPQYLSAYAPQLLIPGFGGQFEGIFDEWLENSRQEQKQAHVRNSRCGVVLTTDGNVPTCDESIALHDPNFGHYKPAHLACYFVQGHHMGLPVKVYDNIDYALWLLSEQSIWVPSRWRNYLLQGMKDWAVWPWLSFSNDSHFPSNSVTGALQEAMCRARSIETFKLTKKARKDIETRFEFTIEALALRESVDTLVDRFLANSFIEIWFKKNSKTRLSTAQQSGGG